MRQLLDHIAHPLFATGALAFFILSFLGIVFWTFQKSRKSEFDKIAKIPLNDERTSS